MNPLTDSVGVVRAELDDRPLSYNIPIADVTPTKGRLMSASRKIEPMEAEATCGPHGANVKAKGPPWVIVILVVSVLIAGCVVTWILRN